MLLNLTHPRLDVAEALAVCDIVDHDDAVRALVITRCNCLKTLLPSSVPNLELDLLGVNVHCLDFEVNANRRHKILCEHVLCEPHQQR